MAVALQNHEGTGSAKVLLLGQTGAGKTQFINLLGNYSEQYDKNFEFDKIDFISKTSTNMMSDTDEVVRYSFDFGDSVIEVLDTPGFADNRGELQREENKTKLYDAIRLEKSINCLCLFFNGTLNRINDSLEKSLIELTELLPTAVIEHYYNCFYSCTK